jgi:hypothetical protein
VTLIRPSTIFEEAQSFEPTHLEVGARSEEAQSFEPTHLEVGARSEIPPDCWGL